MLKTLSATLAGAAALATLTAPALHAQDGDTLSTIQERDSLLCTGHNGSYLGFAEVDDEGAWQGFDIEMCKALATAILGTPDKLQVVPISWAQRFPALQSGDIDVIIKVTGWTQSRDTELGLQYSRPYFIGPFYVMSQSAYGAETVADLEGGVFCVNAGTTVERVLSDYMEAKGIPYEPLSFESGEELRAALYAGRCDATAGFGPFLASTKVNAEDPDSLSILPDVLALEPEGIAVREGNDDFLDVINWMVSALLMAEEQGITQANVDDMRANPPTPTIERLLGVTPGVGERLGISDDWAYNVIKAVGNYGEIYDRTVGEQSRYQLPRGMNRLWNDGGILYPLVLD